VWGLAQCVARRTSSARVISSVVTRVLASHPGVWTGQLVDGVPVIGNLGGGVLDPDQGWVYTSGEWAGSPGTEQGKEGQVDLKGSRGTMGEAGEV
jgi:hypothetical protein